MDKKNLHSSTARVQIPELAVALKSQSAKNRSVLMTAGVPFTMRPLVPEDLGTFAEKGRTDLVRLTDRSGAIKMTRTVVAEVRRIRKAP